MFGFLSFTREKPAEIDIPGTPLHRLRAALRANAASEGGVAIKLDPRDTSFVGPDDDEDE